MWDQINRTQNSFTPKRVKMRTVIRSKWELPVKKSQSYWNGVVENIERKVTKVRPSLITLNPQLTSAAQCEMIDNFYFRENDNNKTKLNYDNKNNIREPTVRVSPPSSSIDSDNITNLNNRDVEHIGYLKNRDIGNVELHHPTVIESQEVLQCENIENDRNDIKGELFKTEMSFTSINKILHLSKISKCVNDFLSTTRLKVKVGPSVNSKSNISPVQTPRGIRDKNGSYLIFKKQLAVHNVQSELITSEVMDVNNDEDKIVENIQPSPKRVLFQDIKNDDETLEYPRISRPRAPSLGVASAVPSFGKILSSLEFTDSIETPSPNGSILNLNECPDLPQTSKDYLKVPKLKTAKAFDEFLINPKNLLKVPDKQVPAMSFYPHLKSRKTEETSTYVHSIESKERRHLKKSQAWPRKSIVHVLKALKLMKHGEKMRKKIEYEDNLFFATSLPLQVFSPVEKSSSSSEEQNLSDRLIDFRDNDEDESLTSSSVSTCTYKSVRERLIKTPIVDKEKNNTALEFTDNVFPKTPSNVEYENDLPVILKNKSATILNNIPQIGGMFPRKHADKCLACLHLSMKKELSKDGEFFISNEITAASSSSSFNDNSFMNNLNSFLNNELPIDEVDPLNSLFCIDNEQRYSDGPSELLDNTYINDMNEYRNSISAMSSTSNQISGIVTTLPHSLDMKQNVQGADNKSIMSSKSFVSTQSLASERSKTISDQDDSDQAIDEAGGMEEGIVESRSKFLAPCHAPLNLRPTLEPLRALRSKTARSIQSRMASLEKSTDVASDEESDDDEVLITSAKINKSPSPKLNENIGDVDENYMIDDELILDQLTSKISFVQTSICEEIFTKLNITRDTLDYDPSESFRPSTPILSPSAVIEISKKSILEGKSVHQTLNILANEYTARLSEKSSKQSYDSNTCKLENITKNLLKSLVDSKLYFNPEITVPQLVVSSKQKSPINSRQLRRVLPVKSYNLIAPLLGIPQWHPKHWSAVKDARRLRTVPRKVAKFATEFAERPDEQFTTVRGSSIEHDLIVHPTSEKESFSSDYSGDTRRKKQLNPYALFLSKPRRKAVVWRPLTEHDLEGYDPEATLKKRAAKLTDTICADFCQWLRSLGGFDTTIDEEVLKDMFETDFTADACRTMQVCIKEMPVIPTAVANITHCPEAGEIEKIKKHLLYDALCEKKPANLIGFGAALPRHMQFRPPNNQVEARWLRCPNVPEDLESMNAIWKDITHLDSVKGFAEWLQAHPEVKCPRTLKNHMTKKSR